MTGWRIGELLALRWVDVNLEAGTIFTRHADNKGNDDELVRVHPVVVDHLQKIRTADPFVFPWNDNQNQIWAEFARIQSAIGINLVCREDHEHTAACHVYGFHDFRRAFATVNAKRMKPEALQKLMRHQSYRTTLGYINLAEQIDEAVANLRVPEIFQKNGPPPQAEGSDNGDKTDDESPSNPSSP